MTTLSYRKGAATFHTAWALAGDMRKQTNTGTLVIPLASLLGGLSSGGGWGHLSLRSTK